MLVLERLHYFRTRYSCANFVVILGVVSLPVVVLGCYAGFVASAFTFGRFLGGYALGHVADSMGRKPVIIVGMSALVVFPLAFGLSTTLAWAITWRCVVAQDSIWTCEIIIKLRSKNVQSYRSVTTETT